MANAIIATVFAALGLASPSATDVEGSPAPQGLSEAGRNDSAQAADSARSSESPPPPVADKSPGVSAYRQGLEATPVQASILACIRRVESQGNYRAVSKGNTWFGAYQFSRRTWASVGGSGNPAEASPAEQDRRALVLYQREGLSPWPPAQRRCV